MKECCKRTKQETLAEEIKFLEETIKSIEVEIEYAKKANTRNGEQSIIIYNMILIHLRMRLRKLKEGDKNE